MLRVTGGASGGGNKRAKMVERSHDFNIAPNEHPVIAAALAIQPMELKTFVIAMADPVFDEFSLFSLDQKNAERIVDKVVRDSTDIRGVQDSSKTSPTKNKK